MTIIKEITLSMRSVLDTFFGSDTDVMSDHVKEIMSNPNDRKSYLDALKRLKELEENGQQGKETITLSNNQKLVLTT